MNSKIRTIIIITAQGVKSYDVANELNGMVISRIEEKAFYVDGDPFTFYAGYTEQDRLIFKISALAPISIEYI
jgi:hypothetical protein